jgi:hypothetical protein
MKLTCQYRQQPKYVQRGIIYVCGSWNHQADYRELKLKSGTINSFAKRWSGNSEFWIESWAKKGAWSIRYHPRLNHTPGSRFSKKIYGWIDLRKKSEP